MNSPGRVRFALVHGVSLSRGTNPSCGNKHLAIAQYPIQVVLDHSLWLAGSVHIQRARDGIGVVVHRVSRGQHVGSARSNSHGHHFLVRRHIAEPIVADGIGVLAYLVADTFRGGHEQSVRRKEQRAVAFALANHLLQKVDIGARVGFAREQHDGPVLAAYLAPVGDPARIDIRELGNGQ